MSYIDLRSVQAGGERLLEQISILRNLQEELRQIEQRIEDMDYVDETLYFLQKSQKEIEEENQNLQAFVQCMKSVENIYKTTEQKITDVYNLEQIIHPQAVFHMSRITGLDEYRDLLKFLIEE